MGMFSLVLLSASIGLTLGFIVAGTLKLIGLISADTFWLIVQGCGALGLVAATFVILRIRFRKEPGNTGDTDERAQM